LSMSYKNKNNKYDDDSPNPILWAWHDHFTKSVLI
jgi:hypothetical protein